MIELERYLIGNENEQPVDIAFQNRKLEKVFNSAQNLQKAYGAMARTIAIRLAVLRNARSLALVPVTPPDRRHQLKGNRDELFAVNLNHPFRLVFEPNHNPVPRKADGGIDTEQVSAITILEVIDYH
jgi:proteic killer suppression protein